jgi:hypothetical protein
MSDLALKSWKHAEIRCWSGYKAIEKPISFHVDDRQIEVRTILKSWREPDCLCFRVETDDGRVYELRQNEYEDSWQVRESAGRSTTTKDRLGQRY